VEALIGADTVNTVPPATLDAYRDHGQPEARLAQGTEQARWVLEQLPRLGIDLAEVTRKLEAAGLEQFAAPFDRLLAALAPRP